MTNHADPMSSVVTPPLSLAHLPPPLVEQLRDALLLPVAQGKGLAHGVVRADGSFAEMSRTRISDNRFSARPALPAPQAVSTLKGRYLFAGLGRHHFGHFLMETASRLWALDQQKEQFDGLILMPMPSIDFAAVMRRRLHTFFDMIGCTLPIHLVRDPVRVEHLALPSQGFGHLEWAVGTDAFRHFMRGRIDAACPPQGPEKIYISRSRLKHSYQHVDQEGRIEKMFKRAGYTIFHPQRHSIKTQCQHYRAAHTIVGGDGSAFHLAPFAMQPETRIGLIQRRASLPPVEAIIAQIKAFAAVDLVWLNPLATDDDGAPLPAAGRNSAQPINIKRLRRQLERAELI